MLLFEELLSIAFRLVLLLQTDQGPPQRVDLLLELHDELLVQRTGHRRVQLSVGFQQRFEERESVLQLLFRAVQLIVEYEELLRFVQLVGDWKERPNG